jgi:beta-lactamase regulating signal transducer with metallopeptidase domain
MTTALDALLHLALQHVWQSALLLALAWGIARLRPLSAALRAGFVGCLFLAAVVAPLLALSPAIDLPLRPTAAAPQAASRAPVPMPQALQVAAAPAPAIAASSRADVAQWLALLWLLGTAWSLRGLGSAYREARRLRADAVPCAAFDAAIAAARMRVEVRVSDAVSSPMLVGLRRPCVLLPRGMAQSLPEQLLLGILHHELAHVRRHDLWAALLQRLCLALYWWSPALRMLGAQLDLARELACDAAAARQMGSGHRYADALVAALEARAAPGGSPVLGTAMLGTRHGVRRRIDQLLWPRATGGRWTPRLLALGCMAISLGAGVAVVVATPRLPVVGQPLAVERADPTVAALLQAAARGRQDEVRRLVAAGADVNAAGADPESSGTALIEAARAGDLAMVETLLELGADPDQALLRDGNPLIVAAMQGHLAVVERLLDAGADVNRIVQYDETPLINAARAGHLPVVRALLARGADINLGVWADQGRWRSPLNQAHGVEVVRYLQQHGAVAGPGTAARR